MFVFKDLIHHYSALGCAGVASNNYSFTEESDWRNMFYDGGWYKNAIYFEKSFIIF